MDWLTGVSFLFCILVFALVLTKFCQWFKERDIPPGPIGLPFVGYALFLGINPQDTLLELSKKHGCVFSLYMGPRLAVVLNDYTSIQAAYKGQANIFAGRSDDFVFRKLALEADGKSHGISFHDGEIHKVARKFTIQTFKELGLRKSTTQHKILEEVGHLLDIWAKHNGRSFDPLQLITFSCANVACIVCFGRRFKHDDPEFLRYLRGTELSTRIIAQANPIQSGYPILRFLPRFIYPIWGCILEAVRINKYFLQGQVREHKRTLIEGETRDYTDAFLHAQKLSRETSARVEQAFTDEELHQNLRGLLQGATGTTAVTLQWTMLFMLNHPEVQGRIHECLDEFIEPRRLVFIEDRVNLPYVEAVIWEVQRVANVTPFGLLRTNIVETVLLGHRIPKRSFIFPNFLGVNTDPALWKDPLTFNPNRFLNMAGKLQQPPHFMPYSIGKRSCIGEGLASTELFLIFTNIMHRFFIRPDDLSQPPLTSQKFTDGLCHPLPFKIQAVERH